MQWFEHLRWAKHRRRCLNFLELVMDDSSFQSIPNLNNSVQYPFAIWLTNKPPTFIVYLILLGFINRLLLYQFSQAQSSDTITQTIFWKLRQSWKGVGSVYLIQPQVWFLEYLLNSAPWIQFLYTILIATLLMKRQSLFKPLTAIWNKGRGGGSTAYTLRVRNAYMESPKISMLCLWLIPWCRLQKWFL